MTKIDREMLREEIAWKSNCRRPTVKASVAMSLLNTLDALEAERDALRAELDKLEEYAIEEAECLIS